MSAVELGVRTSPPVKGDSTEDSVRVGVRGEEGVEDTEVDE